MLDPGRSDGATRSAVPLFRPCNTKDDLAWGIAKPLVDEKPDVVILLAATENAVRELKVANNDKRCEQGR